MPELTLTLSNLRIRTRRYLKEETASISQWSDAFLNQIINTNYRLRCTEAVMAFEGFFTHIGTRDIVAEQARYAWPANFSRLLKMELVRLDGRRIPLQRDERHYSVLPVANSGGDEYHPTYRPVGSGFVLEPAPLDAVTGGIHLEWNGTPDELENDGDQIHSDFPRDFTELLVLDAAITAFHQEGMQEVGQVRSLVTMKMEWEERWLRFINQRMVSQQFIVPFVTHFNDA